MSFNIYHGQRLGSTDAAQMPDIRANYGYIKALPDNSGNVYIGSSSDVSIPTTDSDTTTGFHLDANDVMVLDGRMNLNELWYICDNAGDDFTYFVWQVPPMI